MKTSIQDTCTQALLRRFAKAQEHHKTVATELARVLNAFHASNREICALLGEFNYLEDEQLAELLALLAGKDVGSGMYAEEQRTKRSASTNGHLPSLSGIQEMK